MGWNRTFSNVPRIHQFGKKVLPGWVPWKRSLRRGNLEGWHINCRPWGVGDDGRIGNLPWTSLVWVSSPKCAALPLPPPQTPNAFICVSPNAFICVSPNAFICVSPNAFVCVSPNASAESATELASLTCLCSLRSHVIKQSKLKFLSKERIFCRVWLQQCHGIQGRVHWQRASNLNSARRCGSVLVARSEGECGNVRPIVASSPHSRASLIRTQCLSFVLNFLHTCFRCFQTCAHVIIFPTRSRWFESCWNKHTFAHPCVSSLHKVSHKEAERRFDGGVRVNALTTDMINRWQAEAPSKVCHTFYCDEGTSKTIEEKEDIEADIMKHTVEKYTEHFFPQMKLEIIDFLPRCLGSVSDGTANCCFENMSASGIKEFLKKIEPPGGADDSYACRRRPSRRRVQTVTAGSVGTRTWRLRRATACGGGTVSYVPWMSATTVALAFQWSRIQVKSRPLKLLPFHSRLRSLRCQSLKRERRRDRLRTRTFNTSSTQLKRRFHSRSSSTKPLRSLLGRSNRFPWSKLCRRA